jgi:hypothetical protein
MGRTGAAKAQLPPYSVIPPSTATYVNASPHPGTAPPACRAPTVPNGWVSSASVRKRHSHALHPRLLTRSSASSCPFKSAWPPTEAPYCSAFTNISRLRRNNRETENRSNDPTCAEKAALHAPDPPCTTSNRTNSSHSLLLRFLPTRSPRQDLSGQPPKKSSHFHRKSRCQGGTRSLPSHPLSHVYDSDSCQSGCRARNSRPKKGGPCRRY